MNDKNSFHKFMLLWAGGFVSAIGGGLTSFGLGVYVFQQTGSASAVAFVTLFAFLLSLLLSPLARVLADKFDRRLMMILSDGLSAMTFCIGFIETFASPMILSFSDSATLGTTMTIMASGMLLTSLVLAVVPIKKNHVTSVNALIFYPIKSVKQLELSNYVQ